MPSRSQQTESSERKRERMDMDIQTEAISISTGKFSEKRWEKRMEREGEMDLSSGLGSRESILSIAKGGKEHKTTGAGARSKSLPHEHPLRKKLPPLAFTLPPPPLHQP